MTPTTTSNRSSTPTPQPPRWALPALRQFGRPAGVLGFAAIATMALENRATNRLLVRLAAPEPGEHALEIGCGPAVGARYAVDSRPGVRVTAVDASPTAISAARTMHRRPQRRGRLVLDVADVVSLPHPDETFDVAWTLNSLHHWEDPRAGLAELLRVLRPGGRLLVGERRPATDPGRFTPQGLDDDAVDRILMVMTATGFDHVTVEDHAVGTDRMAVIGGIRPR